ncbi:hypothetical protein [Micromonospora sp. NPDC049679]|uniref:hypothetical protein n=1 Tax=Micromonospora sp. NPDC049679 TaxID=3155920 RepID=UPI0033D106D4
MLWWNWCRRRSRRLEINPEHAPPVTSGPRPAWDAPTQEYEQPLMVRRARWRSRQGNHW